MRCKHGKTCAYIVEDALPPNPMFPLDAFRSSPLASNYHSLGERIVRRIFVAGLWLFALVVLFASSARAGDTVYYYYNDAQGTPVVVTDAHGNVVERTYYGPYGEVLNRALRDGPGYTGHEEDAATGLLYMQQRYYDPLAKRFPTVDPVDVDPTTGANFNRYAYANDNPYRYTDPDGRQVIAGAVAAAEGCAASVGCAAVVAGTATYVGKKIGDAGVSIYDHIVKSKAGPAPPKGLVGTTDDKSRQQGGRVNNGPLAPEHGGTGDAEKDFGKLTGGKSAPAPADKGYPEGTRVGENGISIRPATDSSGPRIDIPANGNKPSETLHYPKPPPPPPKLKDGGE